MEKLGYGPNNRLSVTVSTRNTAGYRDPAVIAIDQMKEIYIDAVLEPIETANWFPKVIRKDYTIAQTSARLRSTTRSDVLRKLRLRVGSQLHRLLRQAGRCVDRSPVERGRPGKRRQLVWEIERILARDASRPIIFTPASPPVASPGQGADHRPQQRIQ